MKSALWVYLDDLKRYGAVVVVAPLVGWMVFRALRPEAEPGLLSIAPVAVAVATAATFKAFLDLRVPKLDFYLTRPIGAASLWLAKLGLALTLAAVTVAVCALSLWLTSGHVVAGTPLAWTVTTIITAFAVTLASAETLALTPVWASVALLILALIALYVATLYLGWYVFEGTAVGIGLYEWGVNATIWFLAVVLLSAGAIALVRARAERGRSVRVRAAIVLSALVVAAAAGGAWSSWVLRMEPADLGAVTRIRYGTGERWIWVQGTTASWPQREPSFLLDLARGHWQRTDWWAAGHLRHDGGAALEYRMHWTWRGPQSRLTAWDLSGEQPRARFVAPPGLGRGVGWSASVGPDILMMAGSEQVERYNLVTGERRSLWRTPIGFRISSAQDLGRNRLRLQVISMHAISEGDPKTALSDVRIVELNAITGRATEKFRLEQRGWGWMRWSRDGRRLLVSRPSGIHRVVNEVELRDADTGTLIASFAGGSSTRFLHDGRVAAVTSEALFVYDPDGIEQVRVPLVAGAQFRVGFEPAPNQVWVERFDVQSPTGSELQRVDLGAGRVVQRLEGLMRPPDVELADAVVPGSPASRLAREATTGRLVRVRDDGTYQGTLGAGR